MKNLLALPQPAQLTDEWFEARKGKLTASMIAGCLLRTPETLAPFLSQFPMAEADATCAPNADASCSPYEDFLSSMQKKAGLVKFTGNAATLWGQKYERPISDWYAAHRKVQVFDVGLINHATVAGRRADDPPVPYLSASPDGVTDDEVLLEIKCPSSRKIKDYPPLWYWMQVQIQLAVCDIDVCDFVEAEITEFASYEAMVSFADIACPHGLLVEFNVAPYGLQTKTFRYAPAGLSAREMTAWLEETLPAAPKDGIALPVFWVAKTSIKRVPRDRKWFAAILPRLEYVLDHMQYYRTRDGYAELEKLTQVRQSLA